MKCQILISKKNKKFFSKCRLLKFLASMQNVKRSDCSATSPNKGSIQKIHFVPNNIFTILGVQLVRQQENSLQEEYRQSTRRSQFICCKNSCCGSTTRSAWRWTRFDKFTAPYTQLFLQENSFACVSGKRKNKKLILSKIKIKSLD